MSLPCVSATEQQARPAIFFTSNSAALLVADLIFCPAEGFRAPLGSLQLPNLEELSITHRVTHGAKHEARVTIDHPPPTPIQPLCRGPNFVTGLDTSGFK